MFKLALSWVSSSWGRERSTGRSQSRSPGKTSSSTNSERSSPPSRLTPIEREKRQIRWSCLSVSLATLVVWALLMSFGCTSTTILPDPRLPPGRPADAIGVRAEDIAFVESDTMALIGVQDLNTIVRWGKRWQGYAKALEKAGRWQKE